MFYLHYLFSNQIFKRILKVGTKMDECVVCEVATVLLKGDKEQIGEQKDT